MATLLAGLGSVWLAAGLLRLGLLQPGPSGPQYLLSLAAGALLATAFMHLMPEALESQASAHELFATLLAGLVFFFVLDKAELWHHGHEHHHEAETGHDHPPFVTTATARADHADHAHRHTGDDAAAGAPRAGAWSILVGDSVHCFGDGVLIASAFTASPVLGWLAALSVLAHEVPHHVGDLVVLRQTQNRRAALAKLSLAGAVTLLGGLAGWSLLARLEALLPFALVLASSSFVYVALADLIPQLQRQLTLRQTVAQIVWLMAGIVLVTVVTVLTDLAVAVVCGVIIAALSFAWQHARELYADAHDEADGSKLYRVHGTLFFASTTAFLNLFDAAGDPPQVTLDCRHLSFVDYSAIEALHTLRQRYQRAGKHLRVVHLSERCKQLLRRAGAHD